MTHSSAAEPAVQPVKVLVIDDSEVFLAAVRDVLDASDALDPAGFAKSGEDGVELARQMEPDLALVDVILPGIDGLETCRRLHSLAHPPVVVLCSVDDDPRASHPDLPCSGVQFISKASISPANLLDAWRQRPT